MGEAQAKSQEWAVIRVPLADVLEAPTFAADRATQARFGEVVRVEGSRPGWYKVRVASQSCNGRGYPGWLRQEKVARCGFVSEDGCFNVQTLRAQFYPYPEEEGQAQIVYYGSYLQPVAESGDWYEVKCPGQKSTAWIRKQQVSEDFLPYNPESLVAEAKRFLGTPYLWGGMSVLGIDCSGLMYVVFARHGLLLPRDAHEQYKVGQEVDLAEVEAGDLIFFGKKGRVTHVGMFIGEGLMIHAAGKRGVCIGALEQEPRPGTVFMGVRRFALE